MLGSGRWAGRPGREQESETQYPTSPVVPTQALPPARAEAFLWNGIGCQLTVHPILVPNVSLPPALGGHWGFSRQGPYVPGSDSPLLLLTPASGPAPVPCHWNKLLPISKPQCCPVTWGDLMPSPGGLQGTWCRECFLCLCVMVKHTEQGGQDAGLLAQKTGAGLTVSAWFSLPAACYQLSPLSSLPPPTRLSSKLCPPSGVGHLSVQTRTPWSMPWCLPFALSSPLTPEAVSCVCLCVGTQSHCFTLGIFGKGWGGGGDGVGRLDPGVIWHPSLNSFLLGTFYPGQRPLL